MALPYETARAGSARESEIRKILEGVGARAVGVMVDIDTDEVIIHFRLSGRVITLPVRVGAYAEAWLAQNPLAEPKATQSAKQKQEAEAKRQKRARDIAERAVWAVLVDYIKATAAMIACGLYDADTAFLPHLRLPSGKTVAEAMRADEGPRLLPPPSTP